MSDPATAPEDAEVAPHHAEPVEVVEEVVEAGIAGVGSQALAIVTDLGGMVELAFEAILSAVRPPYRISNLFQQLEFVGIGSIFIVGITGLFTGMVFGIQSYNAFSLFNAQSLVGSTVAIALARELAPVFSGLMVSARVGSAMATELGSMRVSEQIDALTTMAVDPVQYLIVPRLVATSLMMPFLCLLFDALGILGAYLVVVVGAGLSEGIFFGRIKTFIDPEDIIGGLMKAAVFGFLIALIACYKGYNAKGGSKGVGEATNQAVVLSSVTVLIIDYFLSLALTNYWASAKK